MGDARWNRSRRRYEWKGRQELDLAPSPPPLGHNGGPPLDDHVPEWGTGGIGNYFDWRAAKDRAFRIPAEIAVRRARRAAALGLTFEEYQLEILERGRHLQAEDTARIAEIIARRRRPRP